MHIKTMRSLMLHVFIQQNILGANKDSGAGWKPKKKLAGKELID